MSTACQLPDSTGAQGAGGVTTPGARLLSVVRCRNLNVHQRGGRLGNILCFFSGNSIFIQCSDHGCKRWTRLTLTVPGVELDLSTAGISQQVMPRNWAMKATPAAVAVREG